MSDKKLLAELIGKLEAALQEYDRLTFDEEYPHELGAPAPVERIEEMEASLGTSFPTSYRAFLELHDGWSDFAGGAKILSLDDHVSQWVRAQLDHWGDLVEDERNAFRQGAIPILLGVDEGSFLVADLRTRREDRDTDYVLYDYMHEEHRFPDFSSFLAYRLRLLELLIERQTHGIPDVDAPGREQG